MPESDPFSTVPRKNPSHTPIIPQTTVSKSTLGLNGTGNARYKKEREREKMEFMDCRPWHTFIKSDLLPKMSFTKTTTYVNE